MMHAVLLKFGMRMATKLCREPPGAERHCAGHKVASRYDDPTLERRFFTDKPGQADHLALANGRSRQVNPHFQEWLRRHFGGIPKKDCPYTQNLYDGSGSKRRYGQCSYYLADPSVLMSAFGAYRFDRVVEDSLLGPVGTMDLLRNLGGVAGRGGVTYDGPLVFHTNHVRILHWLTPWSKCQGFPKAECSEDLGHYLIPQGGILGHEDDARAPMQWNHPRYSSALHHPFDIAFQNTSFEPVPVEVRHMGYLVAQRLPTPENAGRAEHPRLTAQDILRHVYTIRGQLAFTIAQIYNYPTSRMLDVYSLVFAKRRKDLRTQEMRSREFCGMDQAFDLEHLDLGAINMLRDDNGEVMNEWAWGIREWLADSD
jgi:hypothetical protein